MPDRPRSLISSLAAAAQRGLEAFVGVEVVGGERVPQAVAQQAVVIPRMDGMIDLGGVRLDCGPGGCGGGGWGWGQQASPRALGAVTPGNLFRQDIDELYADQLMYRTVTTGPRDMLKNRPQLQGEELGELTDVIDWLSDEKWYWIEQERAAVYSWLYGGGGVICFIDDGRPADQEVDVENVKDILGFYALPKWYLVPDGMGSADIRADWYGPRIPGLPQSTLDTRDVNALLRQTGNRFHRSRVIPFPYRSEMNLRQARLYPGWNGWGPGIVEGVFAAFINRRNGALRLNDIVNGAAVNVMKMAGLATAKSTPSGGAPIREALNYVKECLAYTGDGIPLVAVDANTDLKSLGPNMASLDKVIYEQRRFFLDCTPYPEVVIFQSSRGGLSGDSADGEWKSYYKFIGGEQESWVWHAGAFGGGLKQAVHLGMMAKTGPTSGQVDRSVKATWATQWVESDKDRAEARKKDAEARAIDRANLGLTPEFFLRFDLTVKDTYPGFDVDEGPLPTMEQGALVEPAAQGSEPAATPATAAQSLAEEQQADPNAPTTDALPDTATPAPPAVLPPDLMTEKELRQSLKVGKQRLRSALRAAGVANYGVGTARRHSLGEVVQAIKRLDSAMREAPAPLQSVRMDPFPNFHAARQRAPGGGRTRTKTLPNGVGLILEDGEVQSVRLPRDKFSAAAARSWLRDNGYSTAQFEAADPG